MSSKSIGVVACGALKSLPDGTTEVKSVHVDALARGRGLARVLMVHLVGTAKSDGYSALVLETGTMDEYSAARGLYEALGFVYCDPIFGYGPASNSAFMRLPLDPANLSPQ
ncbi:MAG: GNAT family N-acetyltransferase [Rhodobacteraceae bacterium]|nr:GNAT family N-acetyltransferase [Paracoccaceae bacterium]